MHRFPLQNVFGYRPSERSRSQLWTSVSLRNQSLTKVAHFNFPTISDPDIWKLAVQSRGLDFLLVGVCRLMENSQDKNIQEGDGDGRNATNPTSSSMGSGIAADVLLWKRRHVSFGVIVVATVAWLLFERSGLSFLSICSDVLLILIVLLFLRANFAALRNKQPQTLPKLVLSEEMVNNAAASFRVKINNMLLMAHDIALGKDFRLFFKVVVYLWLLSVIGSFFSFFTIAYIGTILLITIPALYNKYDEPVDRYCGMIQKQFSKHYKIVDESVIFRLPRNLTKDKDS